MKEIKPKKLTKASLIGKDWESRLWGSIPCSPTDQLVILSRKVTSLA